jgi:hypothetical protein
MTSRVRLALSLGIGVLLSTAVLVIAADRPSSDPADFTVHEWGTFTSVAGQDGAAVDWDALGCTNDLPAFVHEFGYRGFKWRLTGTVRMETPVIYFYTAREMEAQVRVAFPMGLITEWYPRAEYEVWQSRDGRAPLRRLPTNLNGIDTSLTSLTGALEWNGIKLHPSSAQALPVERAPSRYYAARETDAAQLTVGGESEKFLFYRGVGRFAVPLSGRLADDGTVVVDNRGGDTIPRVFLFENRGGQSGYRDVGTLERTVTLDRPPLENAIPELRDALERALVEQGLFPREADAMVETWHDSWFEEGARLIYILPAGALDTILPLQLEPEPSEIARVFVGRIELIPPETSRAVAEALTRKDSRTVERYRRFLAPILTRIEATSPEMAHTLANVRRSMKPSSAQSYCR